MILGPSDFEKRPYRVLNPAEATDFEDFIGVAEKELLISLLGYSLWAELEASLDASAPDAELVALKDGAEYVYLEKTYKYNGIVDLLVPAIYSKWIDQGTYKFSASGFVQTAPAQENLTVVDNEPFIVQAWNDYVAKVGICKNQKQGTLYGFMKANESDYPDWCFTQPELKNRYGL